VGRVRESSLSSDASEKTEKTYITKHGTEDREIARRCLVSHQFVGNVRDGLSVNRLQIDQPPRKVERGGTVYSQHTENIGRSGGGAGLTP
jgi:hypothetical protein